MSAPHVLPRGRHAAPRHVVWQSQRGRLLAAMAAAVAEKGYARVAVADVVERAGVSRKTFYEQFANKEACFLAAYDAAVELVLRAIDEALDDDAPDPMAAAAVGTRAYLATLAANPDFARTFLVEVLAAGAEARERRAAVHERFAARLAAIHAAMRREFDDLPKPPPYVFRACVGAVDELVTHHLLTRGTGSLPELEGPILEIERALLGAHARGQTP